MAYHMGEGEGELEVWGGGWRNGGIGRQRAHHPDPVAFLGIDIDGQWW